jgi:hypothetical protein
MEEKLYAFLRGTRCPADQEEVNYKIEALFISLIRHKYQAPQAKARQVAPAAPEHRFDLRRNKGY